jgi:hypothetical protein
LKRKQATSSEVGARFFRRGKAAKGIQRFSQAQRQWVLTEARDEIEACGYSLMFLEDAR